MEIPALLELKHKDIGALIVFGLIGWLIGGTISDPTWAAYTAFLVCDHLFLGWLVFLSGNRVRRPIPIEVILPIHIGFIVLVVVIVAARNSFHFFGFFPFPMAALALWLLSCAIGYEKNEPEPVGVPKARTTEPEPEGQRWRNPVWARRAARVPRPERASRPLPPEPATQTVVIPEPAFPEPAFPGPEIAATHPAAPGVQSPAQPAPDFVQSGLAGPGPRSHTAVHEVLTVTESPVSDYRPTVSGISLAWPPPPKRPAPAPEFWRDNSIAAELRRTYSEEVARFYPSLVATAEDNEAWIDARGKENPTHRKVGLSVREEYEDWLTARLLSRAGQEEASENSPAAEIVARGDSPSQPMRA